MVVKCPSNIQASVLATVLVVATLLLLAVLAVLALWEIDSRLFARITYHRNQRANLESAFTLYEHAADFPPRLTSDKNGYQLFDSLTDSRIYLDRKPWGLYEVVSVTNHDKRMRKLNLVGAAQPWVKPCNFYYSNDNFSLTLTGKSHLKGRVFVPKTGIQYGQFESRFFEGEKIHTSQISPSGDTLPPPTQAARKTVDSLLALLTEPAIEPLGNDSLQAFFYQQPPRILGLGNGVLTACKLNGNLILVAENLRIDSTCRLDNLLIVAHSVTFEPGFQGSVQVFATDTVWIGERVVLHYPSGIFLHKSDDKHHVTLAAQSQVNGYVIIDDRRPLSRPPRPGVHYTQAPTALIRGLLYVHGRAQWQGLVSGTVFLQQAMYVSSSGSYQDLIYRASVVENQVYAYPHWLETSHKKKRITWTH